MSEPTKATVATICVATSAIALLVAGIALAAHVLAPDGAASELIVVAAASAVAVVAGVVGVWLHRVRGIVSVGATVWLSIVGAVLIVGAVGNLSAAAQGGFNNIGASLLLIVGAILLIPSIALGITLAAFSPESSERMRQRRTRTPASR